jgi:hypothetical protein
MLAAFLALALAAEDAAPAEAPAPGPRCASFDLSLAGIGSLEEDLARTAGLAGSAPLWPGVLRRPSGARPLWLCDGPAPRREAIADPKPIPELQWAVVPPASFTKLHTGWADDRNDGALWAGRGLSTEVSTGLRARWRWLTAQMAPLAAWQQNRPFHAPANTSPGYSPYANPFNNDQIDLPLRMGPSSFWTLDWGQSYLRADLWNLAVGFSTENLWWGPGIRNSLLMTNSGPGFPHVFVGTTRPLDIWIGWLEAEVTWGHLRQSKWFDGNTDRRRLFESAAYTFAPAFQRDLTLGVTRVWIFGTTGVSWGRHLDPLVPPFLRVFEIGKGNGPENQLLSLFFRWAFPEVHLEVYGEWARDDFAGGWTDFLMEPDHSQAFNLGLQKLFPAGRRWVRFQVEMTHTFEMPSSNPTRPTPIFYTHSSATQGYTQGGQMLGAGLGPQGDTQLVAVDWYRGAGRVGAFVERIVRNERFFYESGLSLLPKPRHDLEMSYGLRGSWAFREWDLDWEIAASHRYALNLGPSASGVDALLSIRWWPGRPEPPVLPERK